MIYLDNAATSFPKPEGVWRAMDRVLRSCGNPGRGGHVLVRNAEEEVEAVRMRVARFFGAPAPERVIFTLNATDSLNMALKGFLRPGDHVILTPLEHNSVVRPLEVLARHRVEPTEVACDGEGFIDPAAFEAAMTPRTRLAVVNWVSNVIGTIQPMAALAGVCRKRGVRLLADASQAAGHIPIARGSERGWISWPRQALRKPVTRWPISWLP